MNLVEKDTTIVLSFFGSMARSTIDSLVAESSVHDSTTKERIGGKDKYAGTISFPPSLRRKIDAELFLATVGDEYGNLPDFRYKVIRGDFPSSPSYRGQF